MMHLFGCDNGRLAVLDCASRTREDYERAADATPPSEFYLFKVERDDDWWRSILPLVNAFADVLVHVRKATEARKKGKSAKGAAADAMRELYGGDLHGTFK